MANHNKMVGQQQSPLEGNVIRVYVNPNFNNPVTTYNRVLPNSGSFMHINPKFSHLLPNIQQNTISSKSKIYINPNFIRSNNLVENQCTNSIGVNVEIKKCSNYQTTANKSIIVESSSTITKSRYQLVRHNENALPIKPAPVTLSNTVKLGKYKSVRIRDIKRTLESENKSVIKPKPLQTNSLQHMENVSHSITNLNVNRFKFIKHTTATTTSLSNGRKPTIKKSLVPINVLNAYNNRIKIIKGKFKKNNIPCPLFKKFGKCLRNAKGTCEFLHDKKHISICRKFLKGICHDQRCPLSHELTAKKMPTCYFYLNGNCNKEHCPYLHVKLNEKTKICADFVKGYCENGNKCLNRHVNVRPEVGKRVSLKRVSSFTPKSHKTEVKKIKNKLNRESVHLKEFKRNKIATDVKDGDQSGNNTDGRYYQETVTESSKSDICNMIKPIRCKLGPLPSYIKFE